MESVTSILSAILAGGVITVFIIAVLFTVAVILFLIDTLYDLITEQIERCLLRKLFIERFHEKKRPWL